MKNLFLLITVGMMPTAHLAAQSGKPEAFRIGKYEVFVLTENSSASSVNILIDAPQAVLDKYAPDGTVPSAVNAVLIRGNGKIWLVDTGLGRRIFELMAAAGIAPEDVDYVCLTHIHGDHTGGMLRDGEPAFPNAEVIVSRKEHDYWTDPEQMAKLQPRARGGFEAAQKILSAYRDRRRLTLIDPQEHIGEEPGFDDGIGAVAAYGHTPGHTMFTLRDDLVTLLIWGDIAHAMAVQMPHPEISVRYDTDPDMARKSRLEVLRYLAGESGRWTYVVGMHVPATEPGRVFKTDTPDSFAFRTVEIEAPVTEK